MDEKDDLDRDTINANPYRGGKTGPGGGWVPGESRVSGPADYRDPWNPRYAKWHRLKRVVRDWIGGGG